MTIQVTRRQGLGLSGLAVGVLFSVLTPDISFAGEPIRVGYQTGDINNVTMVAYHEGYFEEAGLDVELVPYASGGSMVPALAAGEVDVTWFFPFPSLSAFARGIDIEVFLLDHSPRTAHSATANAPTESAVAISLPPSSFRAPAAGSHVQAASMRSAE